MRVTDFITNILWGIGCGAAILGGLLLLNGATTLGIILTLPCALLVLLGIVD